MTQTIKTITFLTISLLFLSLGHFGEQSHKLYHKIEGAEYSTQVCHAHNTIGKRHHCIILSFLECFQVISSAALAAYLFKLDQQLIKRGVTHTLELFVFNKLLLQQLSPRAPPL